MRNPPLSVLTDLVSGAKWKNVRGLVVGRDVYFWDASYATHHDVAEQLGVPDQEGAHMVLYRDSDQIFCQLPELPFIKEVKPRFRQVLNDPSYRFAFEEDDDISGPEVEQRLAA